MSTGDKTITIYGLVSSDAPSTIRYVGQTWQKLSRRLVLHRYQSKNVTAHTPVGKWIRSKLSKGFEIKILALKENAKWDLDEIEMIKNLRAAGANLLNLSEGGQGRNAAHKLSPEACEKISNALKGKPKSIAHRAAMSLGKTGIKFSQEHLKNLSEAHKGIAMSDTNRKKLSKRMVGNQIASRVWTPEQKKHRSELTRMQWARLKEEA